MGKTVNSVGFYSRYGRLGASSRLRMFDFAEMWNRDAPETADVFPFFSDRYLKSLYSGNGKSFLSLSAGWLRRLRQLRRMPDTVVIEYELLPFFPAWFELRLLRGRRFFLNFDDFVQLKYAKMPLLRDKFDRLMRAADGVICANHALVKIAEQYNNNVMLLPTPVRLERYHGCCSVKFPDFTAVWIGTPATMHYLTQAADKLRAMAAQTDFTLLIISDGRPIEIPGVRCRYEKWSETSEAELLKKCHVGLMPLPDNDAFAAGKSGYKLIQYAAAGLPAIASDVGENRYILRDGVTGFLAGSPNEWAEAMTKLHDSFQRYAKMSSAALRASAEYSLEHQFARFKPFILTAKCAN